MRRIAIGATALSAVLIFAMAGSGPLAPTPTEVLPQSGWTTLPDSSMDAVRESGVYWAGDRLMVVGGSGTEKDPLQSTANSQTYHPQTNTWDDAGQFPTDGHDGIVPVAGAWTGSELIVVARACDDAIVGDTTNPCSDAVAATRDPENGWQQVELPTLDYSSHWLADVAAQPAPVGLAVIDFWVENGKGGTFTWDSTAPAGERWTAPPWPGTLSDGSTVSPGVYPGKCVMGDRWYLATTSDTTQLGGTTTLTSVDLNGRTDIIHQTHPSVGKMSLRCLSDAVLFQSGYEAEVVRVSPDGTISPFLVSPEPLRKVTDGFPIDLGSVSVVNDHLFMIGYNGDSTKATRSLYIDSNGNAVDMPPIPELYEHVPAGNLYFARNYMDEPSRWFMLEFSDPQHAFFPGYP